MAAVPYAHIVANLLKRKHPKGATITLAPNPKDIVSVPLCLRESCAHVHPGVEEYWPESSRDSSQADHRLVVAHRCLCLQHYPLADHLPPCQPVLGGSPFVMTVTRQTLMWIFTAYLLCPVHRDMVRAILRIVHFRIWCPSSGCLCLVWMGAADHHAQVDQVHGRIHTLSPGSRGRRALLCFPGHFAADHLHADRCHLQ